ncbi:MmcQ/YjbR family DNA-binding protein [Treponema sp.]|uniref:MmcQ/YjbR family DNA-binding protein n=1 Tax=Treponema sp. TaxID=166 RepID=UPI00298DE770|nr:MmcQ/YjbR family DNA-binding protein [Treponema sp.]MCR5613318.1 MmcQ/YjbR family DNA-binding protein [Treponema sp.]
MDYSYILNSAVPQKEKLIAFGFIAHGDKLELKKEIADGQFYALIQLSDKSLTADVYEAATDEKYVLFNVASAQGAFVGELRSEVLDLIERIRAECFLCEDLKQKYVDFLHSHFNAAGDTPWCDTTSTVYRCSNNKWFGLVMKIKYKNLGFESDEAVWVVNLKAENIESIVDKKSIFPAYHMNKKYWITVLLTAVTDFEKLCELTEKSFELVGKK